MAIMYETRATILALIDSRRGFFSPLSELVIVACRMVSRKKTEERK